MKKLIFFDIDGTLTSSKEFGKILDSTRVALKKLKDNGHLVAIATGRAAFRAREFQEQIGIEHMVCEGGNAGYIGNNQVFYEPYDQQRLKRIYEEALEKHIGVAVSVSDDRIRFSPNDRFQKDAGDYEWFMEVRNDPSFDIEKQPLIRRLFLAIKDGEETKLENLKDIGFMRYGDQFLIIEPDDKYRGIQRMCKYLNLPEEDVVVFGDGLNDRKMFQAAPFCIAMGNAIDELKEIADYVTADSDEDGILKACEHFGWIE